MKAMIEELRDKAAEKMREEFDNKREVGGLVRCMAGRSWDGSTI